MQKGSQKLQSLQDRKKQCQKDGSKRAEEHERLRNVIEEPHAKMVDNGHKNPESIPAEVLFNSLKV